MLQLPAENDSEILGTFCGSTTFQNYIYGSADGGSLLLEFTTDLSVTYSGFQVKYSAVGKHPLLYCPV